MARLHPLAVALVAFGPEFASGLPAQGVFPPPADRREIRALRASGPVRVDGVLDEADWGRVAAVRGFLQIEPDQGREARHDTEVLLLYDDEALYLAARCLDPDARRGMRVSDLRRDFDFFANDLFGVAFDRSRIVATRWPSRSTRSASSGTSSSSTTTSMTATGTPSGPPAPRSTRPDGPPRCPYRGRRCGTRRGEGRGASTSCASYGARTSRAGGRRGRGRTRPIA